MAANLESEFPDTEFVRLCNVYCRHMALITLEKIHLALSTMDDPYVVQVDPELSRRALHPIQRMLNLPAG